MKPAVQRAIVLVASLVLLVLHSDDLLFDHATVRGLVSACRVVVNTAEFAFVQ